MIRAYDELYLDLATANLGSMFDYAVDTCGYDIDEFGQYFLQSKLAYHFEICNPTFVAGKTGPELAKYCLVTLNKDITNLPEEVMYSDKSPEYWVGWALAYYQWFTNRQFAKIIAAVSLSTILRMYPTLHEADIHKFVETINSLWDKHYTDVPLKQYRKRAGLSQSMLAKEAAVSLRLIQQLEQRQRDIRKTHGDTLLKLSKILKCKIEDLLAV